MYQYSKVLIKMIPLVYNTSDSYNNIHNNGLFKRDTIEGQYCDGISFSTWKDHIRYHLLTWTEDLTGWDTRVENIVGTDYLYGNSGQEFTYECRLPFLTDQPIEVRFMTDQEHSDEDIGFTKLQIFIK